MDRIIKLSDLKQVVAQAYDKFKDEQCGDVDARFFDANTDDFAITVTLTDGTVVEAGNTKATFPMGDIAKVPVLTTLFSQMESPRDVMDKLSGGCMCGKGSCPTTPKPHHLPVSRKGVRAVSAIQPTGDSDGKFDIISSMLVGMAGSSPVLDDKLYQKLSEANREADVENRIAEAEYLLYDEAPIAIDLYTRLTAMRATTGQLAAMGATIAADGKNPVNGSEVFDGSISQRIVSAMAVKGMRKRSLPWLVMSGVPAQSGFGGGIVGVVPGVMGIAAYSPKIGAKGVSPKAAHAIAFIANQLGINALASAKIKIEKN